MRLLRNLSIECKNVIKVKVKLRSRIVQNLPQIIQDGPSWFQDGANILLGSFLEHLWWSRERSLEKLARCKTNDSTPFWLHFWVLAGLVEVPWGIFWTIVATSWAVVGDVSVKFGA